ncbi:MAG: aminopeptidase [Bacteroidetes bacterium QS_8_68_15]|nr:MAG: aminopeptidase [Bacteroidetes bacterium QS_8_68_15]
MRTRRFWVFTVLLNAVLLIALAAGPDSALAQSDRDHSGWQQEVAYDMDVTLKADRHRMRGTQRLRYTNHSPDTLQRVFYHLYFNAFQPHSMMAERNRHLPDPDDRIVPRIFNLGPEEIGYHRIQSLRRDGRALTDYDIDDTGMEVPLDEPILPGETTTFTMRFRSQVPLQTRRSGRDNREGIDYSMTQWYPKMAEYDEQGWHADPYVGREFYAPYGTFDVAVTLPAKYTLGATGRLQNPGEIGHGYDQSGSGLWRPSESGDRPADSLTWRYHAENVHDFAWAADPDYLHRRIVSGPPPGAPPGAGDVTYHLLYQPGVAERWEPMANWVPDLMNFFSDEYGPYPYPQFTVAQGGDGGMEYPMMVLLTGRRSPASLLGVTAHEGAHEWFYAVLGSNEADYAWMDEGFTSYATEEGIAHVRGRRADHTSAYTSVLHAQDRGLFERLNTPADFFETNLGYGIAAYPGGEMVVDMLGYVIGDANLRRFLEEYYNRFKFRHPQPDDLENIAEDVSDLRLDWYFEQFIQTTRRHDYALGSLDAERSADGDGWIAEVTTLDDGTEHWATVPLSIMEGHKPVPRQWTVAEAWPWTFEEHTIRLEVPGRPVKAVVNPKGRAPDENRLNNSTHLRVEPRFLEAPGQSWQHYRLGYRPLAQYAHDFGVGAGLQARGQYLFEDHRVRAMLKLWPQVLATGGEEPELLPDDEEFEEGRPDVSAFDGIDYELSYQTEVPAFGAEAEAGARAEKHLGVLQNTLFFERPLAAYGSDADQTLSVSLLHQLNPSDRVFGRFEDRFERDVVSCEFGTCGPPTSLTFTESTNPFEREHLLSARFGYEVESDGGDRVATGLEVGASLWRGEPRPNATRFWLEARKTVGLGSLLTGRADVNFGFGDENLARHKRFRLGAGSVEESYLHASDDTRDGVGGAPAGRNLLSGALTFEAGPFSQNDYARPFRLEAFSGAGKAWTEGATLAGFSSDDLLADAGLGARYALSELPILQDYTAQSDVLSGLDLVAKFPFWASDPDRIAPDGDPWAFRWRLGLSLER